MRTVNVYGEWGCCELIYLLGKEILIENRHVYMLLYVNRLSKHSFGTNIRRGLNSVGSATESGRELYDVIFSFKVEFQTNINLKTLKWYMYEMQSLRLTYFLFNNLSRARPVIYFT